MIPISAGLLSRYFLGGTVEVERWINEAAEYLPLLDVWFTPCLAAGIYRLAGRDSHFFI